MLAFMYHKFHLRSPAVISSIMVLASCYTTIPIRSAPSRGAEVVLDMTTEATDRMSGFLGRGTVSARGRLLAWEPDSIVVSMLATEIEGGGEQLWRGERVAIPREAVARITEKRVNRWRTGLIAVAGLALVVAALDAVIGGEGGLFGGGTKPAPQ